MSKTYDVCPPKATARFKAGPEVLNMEEVTHATILFGCRGDSLFCVVLRACLGRDVASSRAPFSPQTYHSPAPRTYRYCTLSTRRSTVVVVVDIPQSTRERGERLPTGEKTQYAGRETVEIQVGHHISRTMNLLLIYPGLLSVEEMKLLCY